MAENNNDGKVENKSTVGRRVVWHKDTDAKLDKLADTTGLSIGEVVDILIQSSDKQVKAKLEKLMTANFQKRLDQFRNS